MWEWSAQPVDGREIAAVLVGTAPLEIRGIDEVPWEVTPGAIAFLHPHRVASVTAKAAGTVIGAWVPWDTLDEIDSGVLSLTDRIPMSTLGRGLHAFVSSLITQRLEATPYTDYLVERLVAEMVFGVILEAIPVPGGVADRAVHGISRARSLMMMRRADPSFGVADLARDMHMSIRQMERLFAAHNSTPGNELRRMRVELARDLMSDIDYAPLGVDEIALYSGFRGGAALRRAFAWAGLPAPLKYRNALRH